MENKWQVEINREGNLLVHAYSTLDALDNLFGIRQMQSGLCIYAHELPSLRSLLLGMYPDASLDCLEEIEQLVKENFLDLYGLNEFRYFLDNAHIPYSLFNRAA